MVESITVTMSRGELALLLEALTGVLDSMEYGLEREVAGLQTWQIADPDGYAERHREFEDLSDLHSRLHAVSLTERSSVEVGPNQPVGVDGDIAF